MKFNCGPTRAEKRKAKKEWHRWFAWYPVRLRHWDEHNMFRESRDCRWLEVIERKGHMEYDGWSFEYRAKEPK